MSLTFSRLLIRKVVAIPLCQVVILAACALSHGKSSADEGDEFLRSTCKRGFEKTSMPRQEAQSFCSCVVQDVGANITEKQRVVLRQVGRDVARGQLQSIPRLAEAGVRDLVVAGQARCEASFYPPSGPLLLKSGNLEMTLRCDEESQSPEAFVYVRQGNLLTPAEIRAMDARMARDDYTRSTASVSLKFDQRSERREAWEIDITGQIASPDKPADFINQVRNAQHLRIELRKGSQMYSAAFALSGKVHPRWVACPSRMR